MEPIRRVFTFRITNPILSGLFYSFFWMFIGAFALSLLLWSSGLAEDDLSFYTFLVHAIASLFGGIVSGKRAGSKGWYYGCLTGLLYGVTLLVIGFLALDSSLSLSDLTLLAVVFAAGAIGGMFGVNLKK
ncbi:hypothetical protein JCM10914A_33690 [Paenibacillus sp. JCM 10914]|uniref:TIGR04086 family membrane protein n=1 Tax=Paenibacillus sp. JCM 10914 TaxID=1236974 RepID=UPI0003CC3A75|nr:TIGR04086 family membrane protein [Paenibacillus sp. JCM 10914]GAE03992.1 hypothetical protein JCM10914_11 [Paenibacillus sp. JCM 10914]